MNKPLGALLIVLFLTLTGICAHADNIVSGDLLFSVSGSGVVPTSGSFTYDLTTNQFASFTVIWDGITFDFSAKQANYLAMFDPSSSLTWTALCAPSSMHPDVPCDGVLNFSMFAGTFMLGQAVRPFSPTAGLATGGGHLTARLVTVPEPGSLGLALFVMASAVVAIRSKYGLVGLSYRRLRQ